MNFDQLKSDENGLISAIIQERGTVRELMMAWINEASLRKTTATKKTHCWIRSRQILWLKGEKSGHVPRVKKISFDCDGDCLLIEVEQVGAACHEGYKSCFFRAFDGKGKTKKVREKRVFDPKKVYGK